MELQERLTTVLQSIPELRQVRVDLEQTSTGRIGGVVVSPSFAGKPQVDRQDLIWSHLERELATDERARILSLITLTPEELADAA